MRRSATWATCALRTGSAAAKIRRGSIRVLRIILMTRFLRLSFFRRRVVHAVALGDLYEREAISEDTFEVQVQVQNIVRDNHC